MHADLVSHEATFADGMEQKARIAQHSTAPMAGAFARRIAARKLVLTHFSGRYVIGPPTVSRYPGSALNRTKSDSGVMTSVHTDEISQLPKLSVLL